MIQKFVSPGVFPTEVDQSFLSEGVVGAGAGFIGTALRGPAFWPKISVGYAGQVENFGVATPQHQSTYAMKNYLKNAGAATFVRVLGHDDGTGVQNGYVVKSIVGVVDNVSLSAGDPVSGSVLAVLHTNVHPTGVFISPASDTNKFKIKLVTHGGSELFAATCSFNSSSADYLGKVLNTDPTKYNLYKHYLYQVFSYSTGATAGVFQNSWDKLTITGEVTGFQRNFSYGETPWIKSQAVGGVEFSLFKFVALDDSVDEIKIEIANIKPSATPTSTPYGSFDVKVRSFYDTDQRQKILEQFIGCTLDPDSKDYILRKIGTQYEVFDTTQRKFISYGEYALRSKYIRVELDTTQNAPKEALPWGHQGYTYPTFVSGSPCSIQDFVYHTNQNDRNGNYDANIKWGISFTLGGVADRMKPDPDSATLLSGSDFSLKFLGTGSLVNNKLRYTWTRDTLVADYHTPVYASASVYAFTLPLKGGFDGWDARVENPVYLANGSTESTLPVAGATAATSTSYHGYAITSLKRAIDTLANPDVVDVDLLCISGIHNLKVTDYARAMVNDRQDMFYVMDITGSSVTEAVQRLNDRGIDDNYTGCYYPDLSLKEPETGRVSRVSPSVAVAGAISYSDRVGQVFFAPAGLNRGGLSAFDIVDVADRLTFKDRNDLYEARINPIATFPNEGIVVFGQKTLQVKASALDRINVRRLLIHAKKTISAVAKYLVFEPGNPATWQRFVSLVNPILDRIRQNQGVERFKVVMDQTTNTPDVVERNRMVGKIFLQPTRTSEFIDLSFVITNAGVEFGQ